jgi:antitoxin component YwqK of YwqJK toxin-antitoxin module
MYDNGQLRKRCNYINNKKEGLFQSWNADGSLRKECNYHNDLDIKMS